MRVLFIGDVVASPGRRAIAQLLPRLVDQHHLDLVVANAENAAGGNGLTGDAAMELLASGVDVLTGGNHTWRFKEVVPLLQQQANRVLRPYNYPRGAPGSGMTVFEGRDGVKVGVLNLQGRVFMEPLPSPFEAAGEAIEQLREQVAVIFVDFHAEATSEKRAMGWYLDGRVSAVLGTHTHVQTADEEILPQGTAYLTDLGMTGPFDSVIGTKKELVLERFLTMRPKALSAAKGDVRLCGAVIDVDAESGRARHIERVCERLAP
jgi:metallophosphoesterase (TIGR00282 family)